MNIQGNKSEFEQIKEVIILWLKNWYYFFISMVICLIIAFIYLKTKTPVMEVRAQVNLRHNESLSGGSSVARNNSLLSAFGFGGSSQNIEDETLKMGSHGQVKKVIRELDLNFDYTQISSFKKKNLYDRSPVILSVDQAISDTIAPVIFLMEVKNDQTTIKMKRGRKILGEYSINTFPYVIETPSGPFTVSKSNYYDNYKKPLKIQVLHGNFDFMTQLYRAGITVDFEKKTSDLIHLSMNTENTEIAKKILNEVIETYNAEWEYDKNLISGKTIDFIKDRLLSVKDDLADADQAIQTFKDRYNLTDIEADIKFNYAISGELQARILEAETQLKTIGLVVDFVKDEKNKYSPFPLSANIASDAMVEMISKYNEVLLERNDMFSSNSQSALARGLNDRVEMQRKVLLESIDNLKNSLVIGLGDLKKKDSEINSKMGKIPTIEKDFLQLKREQQLQQTIYIFLLEMLEENGVKGISLLPKLKVIDEPYVINKPVEPSLMKVAITTLFFGGIVFPLSALYGFPVVRSFLRKRKEK